jgi:hypothetical protein
MMNHITRLGEMTRLLRGPSLTKAPHRRKTLLAVNTLGSLLDHLILKADDLARCGSHPQEKVIQFADVNPVSMADIQNMITLTLVFPRW